MLSRKEINLIVRYITCAFFMCYIRASSEMSVRSASAVILNAGKYPDCSVVAYYRIMKLFKSFHDDKYT